MPFFSGILDGYVQAEPVPQISGSVELAVFGGSSSGYYFGSMDLYLHSPSGDYGANNPSGVLNVTLQGSNSAFVSGDLNVSIPSAEYPKATAYVELTLWNTGASGYLPMAIIGGGVGGGTLNAGYYLFSGSPMNMFIQRMETASIDILLLGQGTAASGTLDMVMSSHLTIGSGQDLAMPYTYSKSSGFMDFYTHGY